MSSSAAVLEHPDTSSASTSNLSWFGTGRDLSELFAIDPYRRAMLLSGQDEIGKTLMLEERIAAFEQRA